MYMIEILLPLYDNEGRRLPKKLFDHTSRSLAKSHGGVRLIRARRLWDFGSLEARNLKETRSSCMKSLRLI
jgi:hypothetical protein